MTALRETSITWEEGRSVSGRLTAGTRSPGVLLAHGAGAGQDHPGIVALRDGIAASDFPVLTFNYPYIEEGRKSPDRQPVLLACHRAVAAWFRDHADPDVVLAGRSMGGRMGTLLAADGEPCVGLVLYAYPLHPIGKPERLRAGHLPEISQPMLFFEGTRDPMAKPELVDQWIRPLPGATVEIVEDGDHSFRVRKSSGRKQEDVFDEIVTKTVGWLTELALTSVD